MNKPSFRDIPTFPHCNYKPHVSWRYLEEHIREALNPSCGAPLDLDPDFQRGYVWTEAQQIAYVEYILRAEAAEKTFILIAQVGMRITEAPT